MSQPALAVVVPVFNEERGLPELYRRLNPALEGVGLPYEVICIDDGSQDRSLDVLREIHKKNFRWKVISLSRNFGHASACTAGLDHAKADAIVLLDADLQDPPELIPELVRKWREGFEVVYGFRTKRKETYFRQLLIRGFYRTLGIFSDFPLPKQSGSFSLLDRRVVEALRKLPERHRYLTGLRSWVGFRQVGVPYERQERWASVPGQTLPKLFGLAADAIFSFSIIPLRIATLFGVFLALVSFGLGLNILYEKLFTNKPIVGWTSTMLAILTTAGMILMTLGVIGEYIGRIYNEIKHRPHYIVSGTLGFD
ncbi:MAG: glycosyltransferase family 2 protein [Elusimicrobia bacterium]|nr:glycosyltransferase family 2 protein [Elusimicrobiota bacterium]